MKKSRAQRIQKKSNASPIISIVLGIVVVCGIAFFLLTELDEKQDAKQVENALTEHDQAALNETGQSETTSANGKTQPNESSTSIESTETAKSAVQVDAAGYAIAQGEITEPTLVNGVLLANKKYPLPKTYNPGEDPTAKQAMDALILAAKEAGFSIVAFSSFRSYEYQKNLYDKYVARDGQENADRYSARAGHSEHQTGLAFDVGEVGREDLWLTSEFGETPAGKWLATNAHHYGFILRYPKGKESITGFMYESWHVRYLGVEVATKVYESGLTLEEYLGVE